MRVRALHSRLGDGAGARPVAVGKRMRGVASSLAVVLFAWSLLATDAMARRPVRIDGDVEVVQIDDFDGGTSRVVHELHDRATGRVVELALPDGAPPIATGMRVRVRGALVRSAGARRPVLTVDAAPDAIEVVAEADALAAVADAAAP